MIYGMLEEVSDKVRFGHKANDEVRKHKSTERERDIKTTNHCCDWPKVADVRNGVAVDGTAAGGVRETIRP